MQSEAKDVTTYLEEVPALSARRCLPAAVGNMGESAKGDNLPGFWFNVFKIWVPFFL